MKNSGFTLVELIVLMMIIGILAVAIVPRFTQVQVFDVRNFSDRALAMMRYAQKAAIAQNTNVFFNADVSSRTICVSYTNDSSCNAGGGLPDPAGEGRYIHVAPAGVTFSSSIGFSFSPLGRPSQGVALDIVADGTTRSIIVEPETGYVH